MLKAVHGSHSPRFDVKGLAVTCTELFTKLREGTIGHAAFQW